MQCENVQSRSPEIRESGNIRDFEGESRVLGDATNVSIKHGAYQVATRRADCDKPNSVVTPEWTVSGIPGKIVGQLIDENEKQLAYHRHQVEIIENRIQELRQIPDSLIYIESE